MEIKQQEYNALYLTLSAYLNSEGKYQDAHSHGLVSVFAIGYS